MSAAFYSEHPDDGIHTTPEWLIPFPPDLEKRVNELLADETPLVERARCLALRTEFLDFQQEQLDRQGKELEQERGALLAINEEMRDLLAEIRAQKLQLQERAEDLDAHERGLLDREAALALAKSQALWEDPAPAPAGAPAAEDASEDQGQDKAVPDDPGEQDHIWVCLARVAAVLFVTLLVLTGARHVLTEWFGWRLP